MRRSALAEAGQRPSRPRRQRRATSAAADRSPGRPVYREREGGTLSRLRGAPRSIGRHGGTIGWARRDPLHITVAGCGDWYVVAHSPGQAGGQQHIGGGKPAADQERPPILQRLLVMAQLR